MSARGYLMLSVNTVDFAVNSGWFLLDGTQAASSVANLNGFADRPVQTLN